MSGKVIINIDTLAPLAAAVRNTTGSATTMSTVEAITTGTTIVEGGVSLPSLSNPATAGEVFLGEEVIDSQGNKMTGTFTIDNELTIQDSLITQIQTALSNKATGVVLPTLTNPATAANLEEGYELIDGNGNIVVGTHVCSGGSDGGGGDGYYIFVKHNLPPDNVFVANGVICPSDTTTKVQVDTFNFISFYFSYWDSPIEDIIVTYESEGDFGAEIYDCSVNWTAPMNNPLYCGTTDACNENETLEFNIVYQEV